MSVTDIDDVNQKRASVGGTELRESTRTANERFGEEDLDDWTPHAVDEDEHD